MNTSTPTKNTTGREAPAFHGSSLELRNLTMAYGDIEVLRNVSLTPAQVRRLLAIRKDGVEIHRHR